MRTITSLVLAAGVAAVSIVGIVQPAAAAVPATNVFPIRGADYSDCSDGFGDPRPGGRTHQGNDCFAPSGTQLLAVESGTITADNVNSHSCGDITGDLGGITLWLIGDSGTAYYYAHNSRNEVTVSGTRVARGEVVGYVGNTGNACSTSSHVHFEIHPGGQGGSAVDPYPHLRSWSTASPPPTLARRPVCRPVTGDWNGDQVATIGIACKEGLDYSWRLMNINSGGSPQITGSYGNADSCLPITGDWDGDGRASSGVACKNGLTIRWSLSNGFAGSPSYPPFDFGNANTCHPVTGDWDGNGTDTIGIACRDGLELSWSLMNQHTGGSPQVSGHYGNANSCQPVTGDWDGNGADTIGVACRENLNIRWSLINGFTGSPSYPTFVFGNSAFCHPVTGDWNGDGTDTIGTACREGINLSWGLMNQHSGGSPQVSANFGNGTAYQPTRGWGGPTFPGWPTL